MIRAARGAVTVEEDRPELIRQAMQELLDALVGQNSITQEDVTSIFLTLTPDLHSISPARLTRELLDWSLVPIMSAVEPEIDGLPSRCVRILIQFVTDRPQRDIRMIYLKEARRLRPDLT